MLILFSTWQNGHKVTYPIIADPKRELIKELNMVDPDSSGQKVPSRALHVVGPDKKVYYNIDLNLNLLHLYSN